MSDVSAELVYEVLKAMPNRLGNIESSMQEARTELVVIRNHLAATQTDLANLYAGQANIEMRLARIERRLELVDVPLS